MVWTYVDGGSDDMVTLRENRDAFGRWALRQKALTGPVTGGLSTELEGETLELPVMVAPTGLNGLAHWQGDVAAARGAETAGSRLVLSSASSWTIEEVAGATRENHWFQLYPWRDRELMASLISRARGAGYRAMAVTVDVPTVGNREGERLIGMGIPPVLTPRRVVDAALHPRWAYGFLRYQRVSIRNLVDAGGINAGTESARIQTRLLMSPITWDDFAWMREQWDGPLYLKGVMEADDAERAVELGATGVVVSNHGGRQLDGALATLDALPAIAERVGDRATIILDGGVRRGSDVIKALCLGANACLIGRPMVYGLASRGEAGVVGVLEILKAEMERTLLLMGATSLAELDASWLLPQGAPGDTSISEVLARRRVT
jgi:isopentenyl diphosphate isomerase/L-lactate dehydrogenase-like FMN-dependent dehydrogenase